MKLLPLTQGQFAEVDDLDYEYLSRMKWHTVRHKNTFYAKKWFGRKQIYLHRLILGINNPSILVDHKDFNGLNCQRSNLRRATSSQNSSNRRGRGTSKFLGVCWDNSNKKWKASIRIDKKSKHLGLFINQEHAALAYNKMATRIYREFANLNKVA